jgi:hypothetical protein
MHKLHHTAHGLASLGRHGDSMLVHMSPGEVASLQKMAELKGGSLTINPHTGLPEAGFLKDFLPMIAGGLATIFTGGAALPAWQAMMIQAGAGMAAGAATGKRGLGLLASGLGGIGGGGLANAFSGLGSGAASGLTNAATANAASAPGMTALTAAPTSAAGGIEGALATDLTAPLATSTGAGALGTTGQMANAFSNMVADAGIGAAAPAASTALGASTAYSPVALANSVTPTFTGVGNGVAKVLTGAPEASGFLAANKVPLLMSAAPMLAAEDTAPGAPLVKPTPHYNTTFNRRINPNYGKPGESMYLDSYGPGTWSKDYLYGSNLMPSLGKGQLASDSTLGSFDNPFGGSAPIGMKAGGQVNFDAGGATGGTGSGLADMNNYYRNLMVPKPPAPTSGGADHSAYLSSLAATPFNPNFMPAQTSADMAPTVPVVGNPDGGGGSGFHPFGNDYSYSYDPATQSFGGGMSPDFMRQVANFRFAKGGLADLGGSYAASGKLLRGGGDGMSDSIPAVIRGKKPQRAALADGEFVVPADVVSHLGNGSTEAGGRRLYAMMDRVRKARTGRKKQAPAVKAHKFLPA